MHYSFKSTPTTTLKSRTETITKSNQPSSIPGPFDYNVNKPLPKSGTIAQTKEKRELWKHKNDAPGPGAYEAPSYTTVQEFLFEYGQKRSMSAHLIRPVSKVPGPASYDTNHLNTKTKAPVFSMGNKSKSPEKIIQEHNLYKPSPVLYESPTSFNKNTKIVMGSSNRKDLTETERTPAPGYYLSEKSELTSNKNPRCAVGTEKRELKIAVFEDTPGPGSYKKKTFLEENKEENKGFSCRQKLRDLIAEEIAKMPAPGQYMSESLVFKSTAPRCLTAQSKRKTFIDQIQTDKKDIPAFTESQVSFFNNSKHRASSACNFGKSQRKPLDENESTPGPVAYSSSDKLSVLHKNPSFSCPKTIQKNEFLRIFNPENPGPGAYNPKKEFVQPSSGSIIVMRENRPNFEKEREKPGPGQYNLIKDKEIKFSWSKEKRVSFTDLKNEAKNGSHYNLNTNITKPPSYMNVAEKIQFSPMKSQLGSTGF